ncbi:hypothetical protein CSW65_06475 [Streptococcus agalactiae]|nr:hypothetical protein CSW65_06475 [Streptococcus agalactiae]
MGINLFLVKSRSSTIQDLFLFVFTQDILHYLKPSIRKLKISIKTLYLWFSLLKLEDQTQKRHSF